MDTPNKNWTQLTARARAAEAPDIDVRIAVRQAIASSTAIPVPAPLFTGKWLIASFAALALLAATSGYLGVRSMPELSFALGLNTSF